MLVTGPAAGDRGLRGPLCLHRLHRGFELGLAGVALVVHLHDPVSGDEPLQRRAAALVVGEGLARGLGLSPGQDGVAGIVQPISRDTLLLQRVGAGKRVHQPAGELLGEAEEALGVAEGVELQADVAEGGGEVEQDRERGGLHRQQEALLVFHSGSLQVVHALERVARSWRVSACIALSSLCP